MVFPRNPGTDHTSFVYIFFSFNACKSHPTKHPITLWPNVSRLNFTAIKRNLTYMFHLSASRKSYKEVAGHNKHITPGYYRRCEREHIPSWLVLIMQVFEGVVIKSFRVKPQHLSAGALM